MKKVKEIVTAFGQLKAYHWEQMNQTRPARACAFLEVKCIIWPKENKRLLDVWAYDHMS